MMATWLIAVLFTVLVLCVSFILACCILLALGMSLEDALKRRLRESHGHRHALHHP